MGVALKDLPARVRDAAIAAGFVAPATAKKRPKYGNVITRIDDLTFHSAKEARRYTQLKLLERAGKISCLELQPSFPMKVTDVRTGLPVLITTYRADFAYTVVDPRSCPVPNRQAGDRVVEDVKSEATEVDKVFIIKRSLFEALHGADLVLV